MALSSSVAVRQLSDGNSQGTVACETYRNISMRVIRAYDINNDVFPTRVDVLYGTTVYYDELGVRLGG